MAVVQSNIHFHYLIDPFFFPNRNKLKYFLEELAKREDQSVDTINYIFCTDEYLLKVNQDYLNHDTYTDIITFQLSPKGQPILSDIYISVERVKENAQQLEQPFIKELHRVIFHGLLHLCGYKDKSKKEALLMRQAEEASLASYFVPRGTQQ